MNSEQVREYKTIYSKIYIRSVPKKNCELFLMGHKGHHSVQTEGGEGGMGIKIGFPPYFSKEVKSCQKLSKIVKSCHKLS